MSRVFLICWFSTPPLASPVGVNGTSNTNLLKECSLSNLVVLSCSSSSVKYGCTCVICIYALSLSKESLSTYWERSSTCTWIYKDATMNKIIISFVHVQNYMYKTMTVQYLPVLSNNIDIHTCICDINY